MEIHLPHEITYDFDGRATVAEVAQSLIAQERLIRDGVAILAGCFDGIEISSLRVAVVSISQESPLKEILSAAIFLTYQDDLEQEVPDLIQKLTGIDVPEQYDTLVTVMVMIAAVYGASYLHQKFSKAKAAVELPRQYDKLVNVAGDYINIPPDQLKESVEEHFRKGRLRSLAKSARDFFAPAQRHKARTIRSSGEAEIDQAAIQEIPSDIEFEEFEPETDQYVLADTRVEFRAHDIDASKQGWAAVVPAVSAERKRLHIDPSIRVQKIFDKRVIRGDVLVITEIDDKGEYQPKLYYLQRIVE